MTKEEAYLHLIKEFGRLFEEYKKCNCEKVKKDIVKKIKKIGKALN